MYRTPAAAFRPLLPLAALALAAPAGARTIEGWEVAPGTDSCSMSTAFEDDVTLALIWSPKEGNLGFLAAGEGKSWEGLRAQGERAPLVLRFASTAEFKEWQDSGASVVSGRGGKDGVIGYWGSERSSDLGETVASASSVSVRVGEMDLGAYDLDGTRAAFRELMRCGRELLPAG